jgi:hypothetical protein
LQDFFLNFLKDVLFAEEFSLGVLCIPELKRVFFHELLDLASFQVQDLVDYLLKSGDKLFKSILVFFQSDHLKSDTSMVKKT